MAKGNPVNPHKVIQKRRTEAEMRKALGDLSIGKAQRTIPADVDDSDVIIRDCIEEVLESRALLEGVRGFVAEWSIKLAPKRMN